LRQAGPLNASSTRPCPRRRVGNVRLLKLQHVCAPKDCPGSFLHCACDMSQVDSAARLCRVRYVTLCEYRSTAQVGIPEWGPVLRCVSVVIADRHAVVLCGLRSILSAERDFSVVASCRDAKTFMEIVRDRSPDLAIIDPFVLSNSSGQQQLLAASKSEHWRTRLVFFSSGGPGMETAIARGAYGVIPKEAPPELLLRFLRKAASGQRVLPCAILDTSGPTESGARCPLENQTALSKREREIAQLVCEGLANKQVARQLNISDGTVRIHLHRIYQKLAIESRAMLARWAFRHLSAAG